MNKGIQHFLAALVATVCIVVLVVKYGSSPQKEDYQVENDKLEQAAKKLQEEIKHEDERIAIFLEEEKGIEQSIDSIKNERIGIKEEIYETINNIDSGDNRELYRFFANFKTDSAEYSH